MAIQLEGAGHTTYGGAGNVLLDSGCRDSNRCMQPLRKRLMTSGRAKPRHSSSANLRLCIKGIHQKVLVGRPSVPWTAPWHLRIAFQALLDPNPGVQLRKGCNSNVAWPEMNRYKNRSFICWHGADTGEKGPCRGSTSVHAEYHAFDRTRKAARRSTVMVPLSLPQICTVGNHVLTVLRQGEEGFPGLRFGHCSLHPFATRCQSQGKGRIIHAFGMHCSDARQ